MTQRAWLDHFNQQLQGLEEFYKSSGSSLSLLGYAFDQQRLTSEEFLSWAINHYQIPRLQRRFFTESPPSENLFARWSGHYRWSSECMPVAEWDGNMIVACLEPPQDFPQNPHAVFVLCEYETLKECWEKFHPVAALPSKEVSALMSDSPEGIDFSAATTIAPKSGDSFSFEDLNMEGSSENTNSEIVLEEDFSESEQSDSSEGGIDGLLSDFTVTRLEAKPAVKKEEDVVAEVAKITPTKESSSFNSEATRIAPNTTAKPAAVASLPTAAAPARPAIPPPPAKTPTTTPESAPAATATTPPPFKDVADAQSFASKMAPSAAAVAPKIFPGGKPTITPAAVSNLALEKWKKKYNSQISEKITHVLGQMKNHFEKSLILTLDEKETQVAAFAWDDSFNDIKNTGSRVLLQTPSIFNIVAATQKPFHGYISINEVNEKFFEEWNHGRIPDHVTVSPIVVNEKLVGMLMGLGEKSAYNKTALTSTEKLSNDFAQQLATLKVA
ncbi:hypothetical protein D3C87_190720 [compost metagenome]